MKRRIIVFLQIAALLLMCFPAVAVGDDSSAITASLSKSGAAFGDSITASGTAEPGAWVPLKVVDGAGNIVVFDAVKADPNGNYSIGFKIPDGASGTLTVVLGEGSNVAGETLEVRAPGISPGSGSGGGGTVEPGKIIVPEEKLPAGPGIQEYTGFRDVAENAWYYEAIKFAVINGHFKGISADLFGPDIAITRGMFVTVLSRIEFGGDDKVPAGDSGFTDLSQDWYKNAIAWASQNGIAFGVSGTIFDPDGVLTREQMAVFLYRYSQYKGYDVSYDIDALNVYTDNSSVSDYARPGMAWAVKHGLISGTGATALEPQGQATRAQGATIFMRFAAFTG